MADKKNQNRQSMQRQNTDDDNDVTDRSQQQQQQNSRNPNARGSVSNQQGSKNPPGKQVQNLPDDDDDRNQDNQMSDDGLLTGAAQGSGGKFQQLPLRDYYENSVTQVLLEGLRELGAKRPENPIQFLGKFLLDKDPEKRR